MKFLWSALILLVLHSSITFGQDLNDADCCEDYCYSKDKDKLQTRQYATKTAYDVAKEPDTNVDYKLSGCVQDKVWIMSRHGTRWPTAKAIDKMLTLEDLRNEIIKNYDERKSQPINGALCTNDKFILKLWNSNKNLNHTMADKLAPQGYSDLRIIARNYRRFLPDIFEPIDENNFVFRYTPTQRTEESFKAFAQGILPNIPIVNPAPQVDPVLNAYAGCDRWNEQDDKVTQDEESEYNLFEQSTIMQKTIEEISRRLGYKFKLSREVIETMWDACRFEQAWHPERSSAWCAAFTPKHVTVLEYAEDLRNYYKVGYGNELNSRVACSAVNDMIKHLNSTTGPKIAAYFTHSANLQLLLNALGVAKDNDALKANNFEDMKNRNWKSSILAPFASNFAAIKFSCHGGTESRVMFVLNQKIINFDWCKVGLCDWGNTLLTYDKFINADCNEYHCSENGSTNIQSSLLVMILSLISYLLNKC